MDMDLQILSIIKSNIVSAGLPADQIEKIAEQTMRDIINYLLTCAKDIEKD